MKKLAKGVIWAAGIILVIFLLAAAVFATFGKAIVVSQIEKNLKVKAALGRAILSFPLSVTLDKLEIQGLLKADSVSLSPSVLGFLAGKIVLNELKIINPEITISRGNDGKLNLPQLEAKGKQPPLLLAGLKIQNGTAVFRDKKIAPEGEGYRLVVKDINVSISKITFPPTSLYTNFAVSASLDDNENRPSGKALASGWIDFRPKDMDGKIKLSDIPVAALAPYLGNMFPVKRFLSAKLNFSAELKAKNNDLTAKCHAEFISEPKKVDSVEPGGDLVPDLVNLFSDTSGKITFDFTIPTKLDNPRFDLINLKGIIGQAAAHNIASQPPENVVEKVKDIAEQFKDIGKDLKDIFKKKEE